MKRGGGVHTVPTAGRSGWSNTTSGVILSRHRKKKLAVDVGRAMARALKVEHTIHRKDGRISAKNSYGNDPFPPRDRR